MPDQKLPKLDFNKISPDVEIQGKVYDAFYGAPDIQTLQSQLDTIPIDKSIKAKLWDMRMSHQEGKPPVSDLVEGYTAPTQAPPIPAPQVSKPEIQTQKPIAQPKTPTAPNTAANVTGGFLEGLIADPARAALDIAGSFSSPINSSVKGFEILKGVVDGHIKTLQQSEASLKSGNTVKGSAERLMGVIPVVGPMFNEIGNQSTQAIKDNNMPALARNVGQAASMFVAPEVEGSASAGMRSLRRRAQGPQPTTPPPMPGWERPPVSQAPPVQSSAPVAPPPTKAPPSRTPTRRIRHTDLYGEELKMKNLPIIPESAKILPKPKSALPQQVPTPKSAKESAEVLKSAPGLKPPQRLPQPKSAAESAEVFKNSSKALPPEPKQMSAVPPERGFKDPAESAKVFEEAGATPLEKVLDTAETLAKEEIPEYAKAKSELIPPGTRYLGGDGNVYEIKRHVKLDKNREFYSEIPEHVEMGARELEDARKKLPRLDQLEDQYRVSNSASQPKSDIPATPQVVETNPVAATPVSLPIETPVAVEAPAPTAASEVAPVVTPVAEAQKPAAPIKTTKPVTPAKPKPAPIQAPAAQTPVIKPVTKPSPVEAVVDVTEAPKRAPAPKNKVAISKFVPEKSAYEYEFNGKTSQAKWDPSTNTVTVNGVASKAKTKNPADIQAAIQNVLAKETPAPTKALPVAPKVEVTAPAESVPNKAKLVPGDSGSDIFSYTYNGKKLDAQYLPKKNSIQVFDDADNPHIEPMPKGLYNPAEVEAALDRIHKKISGSEVKPTEAPAAAVASPKPSAKAPDEVKPTKEVPQAPMPKKPAPVEKVKADFEKDGHSVTKNGKEATVVTKDGYRITISNEKMSIQHPDRSFSIYNEKAPKTVSDMTPEELIKHVEKHKKDF